MLIKIYNKRYDTAFQKYLRYGTPISDPYFVIKAIADNEMNFYIWRTMGDDKVRPTHAANNGQVFGYSEYIPTGHPGEEFNCRCYREDIQSKFYGVDFEVSRYDISSWPQIPIDGKLIEGPPSKAKPKAWGEKSLYDIYGGEWKPHTIDKRHNLHWDYKRAGRCSPWLNIPINGKEPKITINKSINKKLSYEANVMLHVRCFDNFDGEYPQILISGDAADYLHAANYLGAQKGGFTLEDPNCFKYFLPEGELQAIFESKWLLGNEQERIELVEIFRRFGSGKYGPCHDYFELATQDTLSSPDIKISIKQYPKEMFYE